MLELCIMSQYKFLFRCRSGTVCVVVHMIRKERLEISFAVDTRSAFEAGRRAFSEQEECALFCHMLAHGPANLSCCFRFTISQGNACFQSAEGDAKLGIRGGVADVWCFGDAALSLKYSLSFCRRRGYICLTLT